MVTFLYLTHRGMTQTTTNNQCPRVVTTLHSKHSGTGPTTTKSQHSDMVTFVYLKHSGVGSHHHNFSWIASVGNPSPQFYVFRC